MTMKHLQQLLLCTIICILPISSSTLSFSFVAPTTTAAVRGRSIGIVHRDAGGNGRVNNGMTQLSSAAPSSADNGNDDDDDNDSAISSSTYNNNKGLKSHLPTPKKRTLALDKFGRRIHDLTDDGSDVKYSRGSDTAADSGASASLKSEKELAADASSADFNFDSGAAKITDSTPVTRPKSAKELAAIASSADFVLQEETGKTTSASRSANLKELLPGQKLTFMKSDKFGRRIQRMEDDGTVNMKKEPTEHRPQQQQQQVASSSQSSESQPATTQANSPSLASYFGKKDQESDDRMPFSSGADLKDLLPKQNMRFLKLDKFGRRVQRMEDDGTVNTKREPAADALVDLGTGATANDDTNYGSLKKLLRSKEDDAPVADNSSNYGSLKRLLVKEKDATAVVDLNNDNKKYGSLKDLLPTKRATWTMLDVKGASVEDTRRTKSSDRAGETIKNEGGGIGGSLKDLMPKRATWTRLDFKGASVVDERRTKKNTTSGSSSRGGTFNTEGEYSNLKNLLPARTINWKKNQVLSSGSAAFTTAREDRQQAMKNDVIASASAKEYASDDDDTDVVDSVDDTTINTDSSKEEEKPYSNLKDLLPERKFTWRTTKK